MVGGDLREARNKGNALRADGHGQSVACTAEVQKTAEMQLIHPKSKVSAGREIVLLPLKSVWHCRTSIFFTKLNLARDERSLAAAKCVWRHQTTSFAGRSVLASAERRPAEPKILRRGRIEVRRR